MTTYRIEPAGENDIKTIQGIARATWPHTFGSILSDGQIEFMLDRMYSTEAIRRQLAEGHQYHLLLVQDNDPMYPRGGEHYAHMQGQRYRAVGYVSHEFDNRPGTTKIHKLYLLPGSQGKGYGRLLINHVERLAARAGQHSLRLDVNYQNPAVDFYEHLGFEKLGRHDTEIGNGYLMEDWQMEKSL
ncbi:ribosomal protein S18 acetylase RimI-like enzyme [Lewinella marina]|uniref:GNAT family N-acetyltransferase n=1 Tax=Neolewinella marina TaxID=438751 RepID=A0A2G0CBT5_9BACT|nr:GNAT family N-acetyltransferase [Neolewinella marina]NJB87039.1 ribosomal protein S18 acetylase RimI-like enzyme [Neolewinella marina]PHK97425.1 GNAT family N-acetyltransferase [Neolewinella marina]